MNEFGILHLKDERFNASQAGEMQLLIKIAPKRISYAIINEKDSRLQVLYDSPLNSSAEITLTDLIVENDYLRAPFRVIKVSVQTLNFTLIPVQYYTRDNISNYEKLIRANSATKTLISSINAESINCIKALDLETVTSITSLFPAVQFYCQIEPLTEGALKTEESKAHKLLLHFNEESFEAYLSTDDKLIFYNLFTVGNADDFNYFLLNIMQQFTIDPLNCSIIIAGNISAGDANYRRIEKYFTDIKFADSSQITLFSAAFEQLPRHQHFSLISLLLCE